MTWKKEADELIKKRPQHILFLCVANSARSQMAEGIARFLAPKDIKISSAGSTPSQVNPYAIKVLEEIGIDIANHKSKSINDIDSSTVDTVITLCAEEVCPVFLGNTNRIHWGLTDPAVAIRNSQMQLESFRSVRDQLRERLTYLFSNLNENK
ncbi:MAG: arsenate reductase ArsC [Oligoflexia bacterium]|nr:arsenate reductase ArsC [Oligoflexia bacterium]